MHRGLMEADFGRIMGIKEQLDELINSLTRTNELGVINHLEDTERIWKEDSREMFLQKEREVSKEMSFELKRMEDIVENIGKTSLDLYKAEMINLSRGIVRNYY